MNKCRRGLTARQGEILDFMVAHLLTGQMAQAAPRLTGRPVKGVRDERA